MTAGELAEALLYYRHVHIFLDHGSIQSLLQKIDPSCLIDVLGRKGVSATYCDQFLATQTETANGVNTYRFVTMRLIGSERSKGKSKKEILRNRLIDICDLSAGDAKKLSGKIFDVAPVRDLGSDYFLDGGICNAAFEDLADDEYVTKAARLALTDILPAADIPNDWYFRTYRENPTIFVDTNIDFSRFNEALKSERPDIGEQRPSNILNKILTARSDLTLSAHYRSDYYASSLSSEIARIKFRNVARHLGRDWQEKEAFQEVLLQDRCAIRTAIDSGDRNFEEFLTVLDEAERFKSWLDGVNPDSPILAEYMKSIQQVGWLQSLPSKSARYMLSTGFGLINPIAGGAISLADAFLIDKLKLGWKPNHFVEKRLQAFVGIEDP